jgi:L-alanine-DL-glutamate epimerase-like enolase superfamily enzyme
VQAAVESLVVSAFTMPTDAPELDGTAEWDSTTVVVVEASGGGETGLGHTYAPAPAGAVVEEQLADVVRGRDAFGDDTELYVDSNGALSRRQALAWAERFAREWGATWYEEPVSSPDLEGLRLLRDRAPAGLDIAAGEYAYVPADFRNLLGCVDCLQADVTRCGGITGFLRAGALAAAFDLDLSAHCAPGASVDACCAVPRFRQLEWFHDHVRLEPLLFDGVLEPENGLLRPDRSRPGNGLELKRADAARYAA